MTSIHTLIEERDRFYADLRFNKHRFIDFLGAMAKHYRHPIPAQVPQRQQPRYRNPHPHTPQKLTLDCIRITAEAGCLSL